MKWSHSSFHCSADQKLSKLYLDTASLVWNGNACNGIAEIAKLFEQLPSSDFKVETLDCQPIIEEATGSHTSILVNISGNVKFQDSKVHIFHQNFILTIQGDVWKIASDCLRFQE
ncbi:NTF2-related export protein 2-like isoform X2 [Ptychodera flava]|uniref:NTF2-related export protein 2-like isoform X2 n=1 Tax=Ptychodera flava TaxID=63121 RepID=UPI00396A483A